MSRKSKERNKKLKEELNKIRGEIGLPGYEVEEVKTVFESNKFTMFNSSAMDEIARKIFNKEFIDKDYGIKQYKHEHQKVSTKRFGRK